MYKIQEEMLAAQEGVLEAGAVVEQIARVEERARFKAARGGTIAGSYVAEGDVRRGAQCRLVRDGTVIYDGRIGSLRRFKDDVREVTAGMELSLIHISEPTRLRRISYAVF